jgi:hypothetical protein
MPSNGLSNKALKLTPGSLKRAYRACPSDAKLARFYRCSEAFIQQRRAIWSIETILNGTGREGELAVIKQLQRTYGSNKIEDMNSKDPHALYDILLHGLNGEEIRIEVKASKVYEKLSTWSKTTKVDRYYPYWTFMLMDDGRKSLKSLADYKVRKAGTSFTRKLYHKTCDYLICVAFDEEKKVEFFLVFPSDEIPEVNAVGVYRNFRSKYASFYSPSLDLGMAGHYRLFPQYISKKRICKKCGDKFTYTSMPSKYCPDCRQERTDRYRHNWYLKNRKRIMAERRRKKNDI